MRKKHAQTSSLPTHPPKIRSWREKALRGVGLKKRDAASYFGHITPHGPAEFDQGDEGQIVLPAFYPTDIAPIEARFMGQPLLRHAQLAPTGADALTENVEIWVHLPKSRRR